MPLSLLALALRAGMNPMTGALLSELHGLLERASTVIAGLGVHPELDRARELVEGAGAAVRDLVADPDEPIGNPTPQPPPLDYTPAIDTRGLQAANPVENPAVPISMTMAGRPAEGPLPGYGAPAHDTDAEQDAADDEDDAQAAAHEQGSGSDGELRRRHAPKRKRS